MKKISLVIVCICIIFCVPLSGNGMGNSINDFYSSLKNGKKIDFVGDSTTQVAPAMYDQLSKLTDKNGIIEGAIVNNRGTDGNTVKNFIENISLSGNGIEKVIGDNADLYVFSYGINDIRCGVNSPCRSVDQIKNDIKTAIDRLLKETNGYILLRIPNTFLSTDPTKTSWLTPLENSQEFSTQLRSIYKSFSGYSSRIDIIDIPSLVFGQKSLPTHPLMKDILHPNDDGYREIADAIAERISGKTTDEVAKQLSAEQANTLIEMCSNNYFQAVTDIDKETWHKMANELRKASGKPIE